ncbi:CKLF-like MARVEL transmembrane domain-containing protein 3 [Ailuropoda melanoleuca]|nr:CKLF-like MARVEL transmembrane domain-containing protein 3 [Ailuropoda melanoleuca]
MVPAHRPQSGLQSHWTDQPCGRRRVILIRAKQGPKLIHEELEEMRDSWVPDTRRDTGRKLDDAASVYNPSGQPEKTGSPDGAVSECRAGAEGRVREGVWGPQASPADGPAQRGPEQLGQPGGRGRSRGEPGPGPGPGPGAAKALSGRPDPAEPREPRKAGGAGSTSPGVGWRRSSAREAEGLSFITFVCYVASSASAFLTAPLLEFLLALYFLFADAMQLNDKWQGLCWPMMDSLRCVTAALIYFAISITAVAKYSDGASKAAGAFGFFATIVFAIDFYLIFNGVAKFLKQGDFAEENTANKAEEENSDSDSD